MPKPKYPTEMVTEISNRIANLRIKNGYSQQYVADHLNVARASVARWEYGVAVPTYEKIESIANFYNVTPAYILRGYDTIEFDDLLSQKAYANISNLSEEEIDALLILLENNNLDSFLRSMVEYLKTEGTKSEFNLWNGMKKLERIYKK